MNLDPQMPIRIVALGGGYVTTMAYRALARRLGRCLRSGAVEMVVVAPSGHHAYHGWSGEVLAGLVTPSNQIISLRTLMPLARQVRGEVVRVDLANQTVQVSLTGLDRNESIGYDHLIVGTGSRGRLDSVPGLAEHGFALKSSAHVLDLRSHIFAKLDQADSVSDPRVRERLLSFVFAGGGLAGVEICAATMELLKDARELYPVLQRCAPRVTLVHSGPELLPGLRPDLNPVADYATRQLVEYGVHLRVQTRLAEVQPGTALLDDGSEIGTDTVVSTLGQAPVMCAGLDELSLSQDGRLQTDRQLRCQGRPNVWAAGDVAYVSHPSGDGPCISNALWAMKQGAHVGENVSAILRGKAVRNFRYIGLGQAASLGVGRGAGELYGLPLTGWLPWLMRMVLFHYFMPSRTQAVRTAMDHLMAPILGRRAESISMSGAPLRHVSQHISTGDARPSPMESQRAPVHQLAGANGAGRNA